MAFNLLDLVKDQVSGQLVKHATGMLGESEGGITKALGGIFPSVLGSMISKGSEEGGASKLFDLVKGVDPGILGNMGSMLGGGAEDESEGSLMGMGSGLLSSLMGDKLGGAVDLVSKLGGIKSGSAMSLFKMAAPMLTGLLSKKVVDDGLDLSSFTSLLGDQKDAVSNALPAGMGSLMGLGSMLGSAKDLAGGALDGAKDIATGALGATMGAAGSVAGSAKNIAGNAASTAGNVAGKTASVATGAATAAASAATDGAKKAGGAIWKYLIPALLIAAAAYFLTQSSMCKGTAVGDTIGSTIETGADMTKNAANTTANMAKDAGGAVLAGSKAAGNAVVDGAKTAGNAVASTLGTVNEAGKAALSKITFAVGSAGSQMMDYINGKGSDNPTFRFKNLNFNSGSAIIAGTSGSEVDNLAAILKAYPDLKVQIDGYTDSDGAEDANVSLSQGRADAVGNRLGAKGISSSRISTKGYGEANPVANNTTAEGKAANRRIEVKIMK